jgi:hypothetical protein
MTVPRSRVVVGVKKRPIDLLKEAFPLLGAVLMPSGKTPSEPMTLLLPSSRALHLLDTALAIWVTAWIAHRRKGRYDADTR